MSGLCARERKKPAFFPDKMSPRPENHGFLPCPSCLPCDSPKTFRSAESDHVMIMLRRILTNEIWQAYISPDRYGRTWNDIGSEKRM
ncbi:Uncharacterized protein dnm_087710 [Desulfonema magnum]|uniref:Uncharacterized protein n=1 Tax=Desulfonema magnum TaxID=45655 RepID=A0A975GU07_9BACT|nr:Uncharacterized protein dnm_087710 [Desulfonema magnum]